MMIEFDHMKKEESAHEQVVTGIVIASEWDKEGNVIDIVIHSNKEEVFEVIKNEIHKCLLNLIRSKVVVRGRVGRLLNGRERIHVHTFELI